MRYQLTIIKNPAGTYSFVGSIPTILGKQIPASKAAVMGCRSFYNDEGALVEWKFPCFPTLEEAMQHATNNGVQAAT